MQRPYARGCLQLAKIGCQEEFHLDSYHDSCSVGRSNNPGEHFRELMNYVTYVFIKLFGFSKEKAHKLMMQVHTEGKAVVASGTREEMERAVQHLHEHGLWATLQRDDHGRV